jgi:cell division protein FtsN
MAGGQARTGAYQVVVGAFASQVSAETLVQQLAGLGQARLVAVDRVGQTLYRVVVDGLANEAQALLVQQKAVSLGLTDARLVRP